MEEETPIEGFNTVLGENSEGLSIDRAGDHLNFILIFFP